MCIKEYIAIFMAFRIIIIQLLQISGIDDAPIKIKLRWKQAFKRMKKDLQNLKEKSNRLSASQKINSLGES